MSDPPVDATLRGAMLTVVIIKVDLSILTHVSVHVLFVAAYLADKKPPKQDHEAHHHIQSQG
jgi:hypothetical protein